MANRYWIGNGGNWSDTAHWSTASGGTGGASVPTSADNVYFDANSFTATGQTVTVDVAANCLDMNWTGALYSPTLSNNSGVNQNVYGSLTLIPNLITGKYGGYFYFRATNTGKTITTAGNSCNQFIFLGAAGGWTLQDSVTLTNAVGLSHQLGTLNTNGKTILTTAFGSIASSSRTLILGSSVITCTGDVTFTSTGLTMTANTATFIMNGTSKTFAGSNLTFNNVEFQGTPTTITGSNTFNDLKIFAGKTVKFTAGTTQTITSMSVNGISGSLVTLQSTTAGTPATISKASGTLEVTGATIKDITATGGATFNAINSINVSGNTGWNWITSLRQKAMSMGMSMGMGL